MKAFGGSSASLAGGIAHEFNNLLVPIILFTEMAMHDLPASSASRSDLERVLTAARRAKGVVEKMLNFSRELNAAELALIDLRTVLADGLNLFSALARPSIEIHTEIGDAIAPVRADAALAVQLVINLCTNAYQAMQGTQGVLTIGLRNHGSSPIEGESGPCVEFWVSDTGHGMDPATAERIFEPFFTTSSEGVGTGLGLSIVHGIVESFGANVVVETEPGKGSTFRIYFPVALREDRSLESIAP